MLYIVYAHTKIKRLGLYLSRSWQNILCNSFLWGKYGVRESSPLCNFRKHIQIEKAPANQENIINLTAGAANTHNQINNFICSAFLYLFVLWVFAVCFFICLCCEYLQCVSLFVCVVSISSVFLYLFVLWVFAVCFFICLCCEYLQCVSLFVCVVSICSVFLYLFVLWVFAVFSLFVCVVSISSVFLYLLCVVSIAVFLLFFVLWVFAVFSFCLCCEYLQCFFIVCVVSICSVFLFVCLVFLFICLCCEY